MKTVNKAIIAASAAILLAGVTLAGASQADSRYRGRHYEDHHQGDGMGRHGGFERGHAMGGHMMSMFETFDGDGDGKLTQGEIDNARKDRFAAFDGDGDGKLTLQEYQALWLDAMRSRMVDRFQDLDEDGDGVVTATEFAAPFARTVMRMDRNDDGMLSRDDMGRRGSGWPRGRDDDDD